MSDGIASDPFSAATLPPLYDDLNAHNKEKVIKVSREPSSNPRSVVEEKINRWSTSDDFTDKVVAATSGVLQGDRAPRQSADRRDTRPIEKLGRIEKQLETRGGERIDKGGDRNRFNKDSKIKDNKPKFEAICAACGNATELNFKPDGIRPVFCKDCLNSGLNKLKPVENTSVSIKKAETALITPVALIKSELIRPEIIKPEAVRIEKVEKEKLVLEEVFPEAPKVAEISLFSLPVKKRIEETEEEGEEVMEESVPAVKSVPVLPNIPVSISEEKPARLVEIKSQPKNGSINKPIILNTFVKMAKNDPEVKMDQIKAPLPSVVNFDSSKKTVNVVDNLLYPEKQKVLEVKKVEDKEEGIKPGEIIHID